MLKVSSTELYINKLFGDYGLKITTEAGLVETDFLDVVFNLASGTFRPFRKPNNKPLYINVESNHPPNIIRDLPSMIEKRLGGISSSEAEFNGGKGEYEEALKQAGYKNVGLKFVQEGGQRKRRRKRRIIWFNPPWSVAHRDPDT